MLATIGKKVKFLHTGEEGVITAILSGGMVNVYLVDSAMEIPAYEEDLMEAVDFMHSQTTPRTEKQKKNKPTQPTLIPPPFQTQYTILKGEGVQLGFEVYPSFSPAKYAVYFINDTNYEAVCAVNLLLKNKSARSWDGKIKSFSYVRIFDMFHDDLNEAPEFEVTCQWITTAGTEEKDCKVLKIKAKTFFKSIRLAPLINKQVHLFQLFDKPGHEPAKINKEELKDYTRRHSKPSWVLERNTSKFELHKVGEMADFQHEIDLHIEQLSSNWEKMSSAEILRLQLASFDAFIEKSIRLGVPRVFVIHGMGEGRLRDQIATRLMKIPEVQTFKNEFHPKYGWGATEVIFTE